MQAQVKLIAIPDAINELMDDVLCELRREGVTVSDRTFFGYSPVAQAAAWLAGHAEVQPEDLLQLKNYLWNEPAEIEKVQAVLTAPVRRPAAHTAGGAARQGEGHARCV